MEQRSFQKPPVAARACMDYVLASTQWAKYKTLKHVVGTPCEIAADLSILTEGGDFQVARCAGGKQG